MILGQIVVQKSSQNVAQKSSQNHDQTISQNVVQKQKPQERGGLVKQSKSEEQILFGHLVANLFAQKQSKSEDNIVSPIC